MPVIKRNRHIPCPQASYSLHSNGVIYIGTAGSTMAIMRAEDSGNRNDSFPPGAPMLGKLHERGDMVAGG